MYAIKVYITTESDWSKESLKTLLNPSVGYQYVTQWYDYNNDWYKFKARITLKK